METVTVTICGRPSKETMAALCELAIDAGLGLMLQARVLPTVETVKALLPKPKAVNRRAITMRRNAAKPAIVQSTAALARKGPNKFAAASRRDAVIGQLRRVGSVGLSFKGLLDAVRSHLKDAGDPDQQVAALRNALTTLQQEKRVERVAGQWVSSV